MPERSRAKALPLPPVSTLLPELFLKMRPTFDGSSSLQAAGSMFVMNDVYILPLVTGLQPSSTADFRHALYGAIGSYSLLKKIAETAPKDYGKLLRTPARECLVLIGSCHFDDPLDELLHVFDFTGFGNARIDRGARFTLITLADIVDLVRKGALESGMPATAVGSPVLVISPDAPLKEAIDKMLAAGVRRLFVEGKMPAFVSDRSIVSFMFGGERLELVKESPERWIDAKVSDARFQHAPVMPAGGTLSEAATIMGPRPDACVLTDDDKVVSRWDMIMKTWKAGELAPKASDKAAQS